jgi:hypothetical protein
VSAPRAYMRHLRELGFCARGGRDFWARQGWDWSEFLSVGIEADKLEATGDALAQQVAALARREVAS